MLNEWRGAEYDDTDSGSVDAWEHEGGISPLQIPPPRLVARPHPPPTISGSATAELGTWIFLSRPMVRGQQTVLVL